MTVHRPVSPPATFGRRWEHPRIPNGRDVRTATSPDLMTWSKAQWLEYDPNRSGSAETDYSDDPSGDQQQLYTSGILPYPRAPHLLERPADRRQGDYQALHLRRRSALDRHPQPLTGVGHEASKPRERQTPVP